MGVSKTTAEQKAALDRAVWVDLARLSGAPCFRNTRVPVQSLIDFLEGGETIDEFLALYPAVSREQVMTVLAARSSTPRAERAGVRGFTRPGSATWQARRGPGASSDGN
jgi:uncharacterized protein (DUF433 family)